MKILLKKLRTEKLKKMKRSKKMVNPNKSKKIIKMGIKMKD